MYDWLPFIGWLFICWLLGTALRNTEVTEEEDADGDTVRAGVVGDEPAVRQSGR